MSNTGILGHIVAWRVPAQVQVSSLRAALVAAGLDQDLAGDLHPRHVLSRALRDMRTGRVIARLHTAGDIASFQLTRELVNTAGADYQREAVVSLDLRTGAVTADDAVVEARARELVAEHAAKRLTGDLTRLIQHLYDAQRADLIPIREQGGAYFVPATHAALVEQSRALLNAIGGKLRSFEVRLGADDTADSVADSMAEYLSGLIAEFRSSCEGISTESRADAITRRHDRIRDLRQRLECYRGLLGASADAIAQAITDADTALLARLVDPAEAIAYGGADLLGAA